MPISGRAAGEAGHFVACVALGILFAGGQVVFSSIVSAASSCSDGCCTNDSDCGICAGSCLPPAAGEAPCAPTACDNYCEFVPR
jgi:hypothetical protein